MTKSNYHQTLAISPKGLDNIRQMWYNVSVTRNERGNKMETQQQGICPVCGSEEITYGVLEPMGECIYYLATCDKCKAQWQEYYNLTFSGHYNIEKGD